MTNQFTFMKMLAQFQFETLSNTRYASSVRQSTDSVARLIFRTFCLMASTTSIEGNITLKQMTNIALAQSEVTIATIDSMILELLSVDAMVRCPTSMYAQMDMATMPAPRNAMSVPVNRIEAPAIEADTHMLKSITATMRMNCLSTFSALVVSLRSMSTPFRKQNAETTKPQTAAMKGDSHTKNQMDLMVPHCFALTPLSAAVNLHSDSTRVPYTMSKSKGLGSSEQSQS
mmetsp:Transcript_137902/g.344249  ORF Transcript_137902/g.344249 Transcript_137902/m.344249 type:complete len:230 (+) Transcript_137902:1168-1857(+)